MFITSLGRPLAACLRLRTGLPPSFPDLGRLLAGHPCPLQACRCQPSAFTGAGLSPPVLASLSLSISSFDGGFCRPSPYWARLWRFDPALTGTPADRPRHRLRFSSSQRRPGLLPFITGFGTRLQLRPGLLPSVRPRSPVCAGLSPSVPGLTVTSALVPDVDRLVDVLSCSRPCL